MFCFRFVELSVLILIAIWSCWFIYGWGRWVQFACCFGLKVLIRACLRDLIVALV